MYFVLYILYTESMCFINDVIIHMEIYTLFIYIFITHIIRTWEINT